MFSSDRPFQMLSGSLKGVIFLKAPGFKEHSLKKRFFNNTATSTTTATATAIESINPKMGSVKGFNSRSKYSKRSYMK
jgi:hypothetical protein